MIWLVGFTVAVLAAAVAGLAVTLHRVIDALSATAAADRRVLIEALVAKHSTDLARTKRAEPPPTQYQRDEAALLAAMGEDPRALARLHDSDPDMPLVPEGLGGGR